MINQHPMPGPWSWWASFDGGEMFSVGPCATREGAIIEAICDGSGEYTDDDENWRTGFLIAECETNHVDLARFFDVDHWLEDVYAEMDEDGCGSDEDGERHPLEELSAQEQNDLQACVRSAIRHWQQRKELKLKSSWFSGVGRMETIDLSVPPDGREELALEMVRNGFFEGDAA